MMKNELDLLAFQKEAVGKSAIDACRSMSSSYLINGSEVHIDIFDDRLEVSSPGGMPDGSLVQERDIYHVTSVRRNPVIADIFARLGYMERSGSGFAKIKEGYESANNFETGKEPVFYSERTQFIVTLLNLNYHVDVEKNDGSMDTPPDAESNGISKERIKEKILMLCSEPKSREELMVLCRIKDKKYFLQSYLNPLLCRGELERTIPDKPSSKKQKYVVMSRHNQILRSPDQP